jgi:hypothetical protein
MEEFQWLVTEIIQLCRYQSIGQLPFKGRLRVDICGILVIFLLGLLNLLCSRGGHPYVDQQLWTDHVSWSRQHFLAIFQTVCCCVTILQYNTETGEENLNKKWMVSLIPCSYHKIAQFL